MKTGLTDLTGARSKFASGKDWKTSGNHEIENHIARLPSQIETDEIEARFFDLSALRMQIALDEKDAGTFESTRKKVIEIAASLEEKDAIPAVKQQLESLRAIQTTEFWEYTLAETARSSSR